MKRKFFLIFLLLQLTVAAAYAQLRVQKATFVPKETGVFHANQQMAINTRTGQTLVVWQKATSNGNQILARVVNAAGNPITGQITLVAGPVVAHPAITYNPERNEFYLAYDDNPNVELKKTSVYVMRLTPQGRPGGGAVKVTTDSVSTEMANFFPRITYNPKTKAYTILWLREISVAAQVSQGNDGLVGALLTPSAALGGPVVLIQKTVIESNRLWGPIPLDAQYNPSGTKLLVAFVQVASGTSGTQANYYLATMDPSLNGVSASNIAKVNNAAVQLTQGFSWGARMALFADRPGFLFFTDSSNVKRRKIDLQGKLTGVQIPAFKPPKNNTRLLYPSVAFATNAKGTRGILIATQDVFSETGAASTWAQVLDANALPVGVPVRVDITSATDTALSGGIIALPHRATDTLFRFTWYCTLAQFKAPGQTYETSGILKLNLNLTVP